MRNRLATFLDQLSASYWFIPSVMAILAALLSVVSIWLDEGVGRELRWVTVLIYVDSAEGARQLLATVASSMITVAGVVFSLTMVVLSLTSQQYGPLVLTHFMRDRGNQVVLGVFTATFLYCLLVLRTIRGGEDNVFVPHISVLLGLLLSVTSLAVLIYFIHHVSRSIQATSIIARIGSELIRQIEHQFPEQIGRGPEPSADADDDARAEALLGDADEVAAAADAEAATDIAITTRDGGYLQMVDEDALLQTALDHDLLLRLEVLPGMFLFRGQAVARLLGTDVRASAKALDIAAITDGVRAALVIGSERTQAQDLEFIITQLSAIAVRALSPSLNDPHTALMVIDRLAEALCMVLRRPPPSLYRFDDEDRLRVIAPVVTFPTLFHTAFDGIRHYGYGDPKIAVRLLEIFTVLWDCTRSPDTRELLTRYAAALVRESQARLTEDEDQRVTHAYARFSRAMQPHQEGS